ncbi:hypothetical protein EDD16DRAFT_1525035 [Pisolithus croceorrhizus]|nr:hypothetical protein EDD16DRAFT_1525035 [Pisolithus croceorrhizus]
MAEIDTHVQEEVTQLSSTLQAEKERELANIEQHYAWLRKPAYIVKHLDTETDPPAGSLPSHPQASTLSTPNLDAIKQIGKAKGSQSKHGLLELKWMVNKSKSYYKDNGLNHKSTLPKGCKETGGGATPGTQDDQLNLPPVTAVVEAVTKSVETALRTLLESGGHFQLALFHRVQGKLHGKEGRKTTSFNLKRQWNLTTITTLSWLKSTISSRRSLGSHGISISSCMYQPTLVTSMPTKSLIRHGIPSYSVSSSANFKHAVPKKPGPSEKMMTILKRNTIKERCWQWLQCLIKSLGEHGMSSEESSVENGIENVLQVKKMEWQKNIDKELEIIDLQQILNKDIFCLQGAKPLPRKHAPDNPTSSQAPVTALPMALYNEEWILQLTEHQRESLKISKEPFPWMKIIAT